VVLGGSYGSPFGTASSTTDALAVGRPTVAVDSRQETAAVAAIALVRKRRRAPSGRPATDRWGLVLIIGADLIRLRMSFR
jgi:hypothetical protein